MAYVITDHTEKFKPGASRRQFCSRDALTYALLMTTPVDDTALMLRFKDGDAGAFETLFRRHNDSLYRYLLRLSLDPAVADDLFQETWTKIINARASYRPTARFGTYLFRVAHNSFIDHVRRHRRHAVTDDADPDRQAHPGDALDSAVEKDLARRRLECALAGLPQEQRDAFLLHEEGGLSIDDIAATTRVNRETAKSRMRYAVRKLKAALSAEMREQDDAEG